jgi:2-polyprenyl-6-methoxyphenol hydroxylase-like FAD-dependent oxidoreductase
MTALVLRSAGHTVRVLERNSPDVLQSQAAGIRAGPELHAFLEKYVKDLDADYCTTATWFEIVKTNGDLEMKIPTPDPLRLTTWKMVYDMLKKALLADEGAKYETGKKVEDVKYAGEKVTIVVRDLGSGETETIEADLVIGADGAHSNLRRIVMEDAEAPKYAGYVTWRGRVAEGDLSEETRTALKGRCVTMRAEGGYMIS